MINVVIVKESKKYVDELINTLYYLNENIKKIYYVSNIVELHKFLSINRINLIIMSFDVCSSLTIKEYIRIKEKVKNTITINFNTKEIIENINSVYKASSMEEMILEISKIINLSCGIIDESELKRIISQKLFSIRYNMKYKGTRYLIETIYIAKSIGYYDLEKIEKIIYTEVAKIYNTTAHNVKCNIINATDMMYYSCEEERLKRFLNIDEIYKPGPKKIISTVLNKI